MISMTKVIDISNYVTDIQFADGGLIADVDMRDDMTVLNAFQDWHMTFEFSIDETSRAFWALITGWEKPDRLAKMHADYRKKTRRRNRRR